MHKLDEELSTQNSVQNPFCNNIGKTIETQSSDKADSTSIICDEELPSQQKSVPSCTANGDSSSEDEDNISLTNEEKVHQFKAQKGNIKLGLRRKSVPSCTANGDSSSEDEDNISLTNEEKVHQEKAQKREIKLGLRRCYPVIWAGDLFLGLLHSEIEIKFISGDPNVSRAALPPCDIPDPTIYIQMRLPFKDMPQRHIKQKMQAKKESCVLLAVPIDNNGIQAATMENQFIHYFYRKGVVGVAEFPQDTTSKPIYKMFIFPPSDFVYSSLSKIAPMLADSLYTDNCYPHLLCFISPICYCLACEQIKNTRAKT